MRVRPQSPTSRRLLGLRRPHVIGAPAESPAAAQPAEVDAEAAVTDLPAEEHLDEARHRAAVSPEDHALYRCTCGFQFEADVSASVACPHCGASQAW